MRRILCIIVLLFNILAVNGQAFLIMPAQEIIDTTLCNGSPITIYNPPEHYRNLGIRCTGGVILDAYPTPSIDIIIDASLCDPSSQLIIFNGTDVYSPILGVMGAMATPHHRRFTASSGHAFIQYVTMGTNQCSETFSVRLSTGIEYEALPINHNNATIRWSDPDHSAWDIYWGNNINPDGSPILDNMASATDTSIYISGLNEGTRYYYQVLPSGTRPYVYGNRCPHPTFTTRCGLGEYVIHRYVDSVQIDWADYDHPSGTPWTVIYTTATNNNLNDLTSWNQIQTYSHPLTLPNLPNQTSIYFKVYNSDSIYPLISNNQCTYKWTATSLETAFFNIRNDSIYLSNFNEQHNLVGGINYNQTNTTRTIRINELYEPNGNIINTYYIHLNPYDSVFYFPTYEGACYSYSIVHSDTFYLNDITDYGSFQVPCINRPIQISNADNNITIEWDNSSNTNWTLLYGRNHIELTNEIPNCTPPFTINDYPYRSFYYRLISGNNLPPRGNVTCIRGPLLLNTNVLTNTGCIDFTDLSIGATTFAGRAGHECVVVDPIDYGEYDYDRSRHTLNLEDRIDPNVPITTIPPGEHISVRLGNTQHGYAQKIRYSYHVDTRQNDLLILKYAIVLQSPWGHSDYQMPQFTFSFVDSLGNPINPDCASGKFFPGSASSSQWNNNASNTMVWQDWNTLGIDLSPYDGQTIYVDLYSQGCTQMGHYGYAYFTLSCAQKTIKSDKCGETISNVFHAPQGFDYKWYKDSDPATIISTSDSIVVDEGGRYNCIMSFRSQNPDANCQITSSVIASQRYPWSRFTTTFIDTSNCHYHYIFENKSIITRDIGHTDTTDLPCESYEWIINDQTHYYTKDLDRHFYYGHHKIQLVAKLANGQCSDTMTTYLDLSPACYQITNQSKEICIDSSVVFFDTILRTAGTYSHQNGSFVTNLTLIVHPNEQHDTTIAVCDSFFWQNQQYTESGHYNTLYRTSHDCDSLLTLDLTIHHPSTATILDTCVENNLPRIANNTIFDSEQSDTTMHTTNTYGCDSTINYSLHVWRNVALAFDTAVCPEKLPLEWRNVWFDGEGIRTQFVPGGASHGEDSTATLSLSLYTNYIDSIYDTVLEINLPHYYMGREYMQGAAFDSFYAQTTHGCDSILYYSLFVRLSALACDRYLQFPNIVTPNGDGRNDRFTVINLLELQCYEHTQLIIYNRWGIPVYNAKDIRRKEDFWDPAATHSPAGTYYYRFDAHGTRGNVERHGTIEVIY